MRRWAIILLLCAPAAARATPRMLHAVGNQLQTLDGCPVQLTGVDVDGVEWDIYGRGPGPAGHGGVTVSVQVAAQWGANFIRLPLCQDFWFGYYNAESAKTDPGLTFTAQSYRALVDSVVAECNALDMYVDLDLHRSGNGAWGTASQQYTMPDDNSPLFWADVAARYANDPSVIFGLFNEPAPTTNLTTGGPPAWDIWRFGGSADEGFHTPGLWDLLSTVRATGAQNLVTISGPNYAETLAGVVANPITDTASGNGILWECHVYYGNPSSWDVDYSPVLALGPIFVGEFAPQPGESPPGQYDRSVIGWIQGGNAYGVPLNGSPWTMDTYSSSMNLVTDWSYTPTIYHGVPVMGWLSSTAHADCMSYTPSATPSATPVLSPTATPSVTASLTPDASLCPAWLLDDFDDPARDLGGSARTDLMGGPWAVQASSASLSVAYGGSGANGTPHAAFATGSVSGASGYAIYTGGLAPGGASRDLGAVGAQGVTVWLYGDGNGYRLSLETAEVGDYDYYGVDLTPTAGVWAAYSVPFNVMTRAGWGSQTGLPLHPSVAHVTGLRFITGAGFVGGFSLGIDQVGFLCALPSPTPSFTLSPLPTFTACITPSPTPSGTPAATSSVTPGLTLSPTVGVTPSPTPTGNSGPAADGPGQVLSALALPNPGPQAVAVLLSGPADALDLRLYTPALVRVGDWRLPGPFVAGWQPVPLPAGLPGSLPNGLYYAVLRPWRAGAAGKGPGPVKLYWAR